MNWKVLLRDPLAIVPKNFRVHTGRPLGDDAPYWDAEHARAISESFFGKFRKLLTSTRPVRESGEVSNLAEVHF